MNIVRDYIAISMIEEGAEQAYFAIARRLKVAMVHEFFHDIPDNLWDSSEPNWSALEHWMYEPAHGHHPHED